MIEQNQITGIVLAGGRGSRMGGTDKGLQNFNGTPLALHALLRLQMQDGGLVGDQMINANRNLAAYEAFGVPVWPDGITDFPGPLGGFLTGLERCETPYLLTVPCDSPRFPLDLLERLAQAAEREGADLRRKLATGGGGERNSDGGDGSGNNNNDGHNPPDTSMVSKLIAARRTEPLISFKDLESVDGPRGTKAGQQGFFCPREQVA